MRKTVLLLLILGQGVVGQVFTVGVKGGIRTTGSFAGDLTDESKRYVVGPWIDLRLPVHFSVEADAFYQRLGYSAGYLSPVQDTWTRERVNAWEFPVLAKFHLPERRLRPFVGVGVAPRIMNGRDASSGFAINPNTGAPVNAYAAEVKATYDPAVGLMIAGGVELGASRLRFTPEIRYTRWNQRFLDVAARNIGFLGLRTSQSDDSQVQVMIGIGWR